MTKKRIPPRIANDPGVGKYGKKWKEKMEQHFEQTGDLYEEIRNRKKGKDITSNVR